MQSFLNQQTQNQNIGSQYKGTTDYSSKIKAENLLYSWPNPVSSRPLALLVEVVGGGGGIGEIVGTSLYLA